MSSPLNNGFSSSDYEEEEQRGRKLTTRTITTTSIEKTTKRSKSQNRLKLEEQEGAAEQDEQNKCQNGGTNHQNSNGVGRSQSCGKISKQLRFAEPAAGEVTL